MARVQVSDDVWGDFRASAGNRSISEVLGELVTREVERDRSRRVRDGQFEDHEVIDAIERVREQQAALEAIVVRLEAIRAGPRSDG